MNIGEIRDELSRLDELILQGSFDEIDEELQGVDVSGAHIDRLLTYLTGTLKVHDRLSSRAHYFA